MVAKRARKTRRLRLERVNDLRIGKKSIDIIRTMAQVGWESYGDPKPLTPLDFDRAYEGAGKRFHRAISGRATDPITYGTLLEALGVLPVVSRISWSPVVPSPSQTAPPSKWIIVTHWKWYAYGTVIAGGGRNHGMDPIKHVVQCLRACEPGRERNLWLLLLAHVAVKCGARGVGETFDDLLGPLVRLAAKQNEAMGAAANYILGNVFSVMAGVADRNPQGECFAFLRDAYRYRLAVQPIPLDDPVLLPGLIQEVVPGAGNADADLIADSVPRPHRYLSSTAIALAHCCWKLDDPTRTAMYLAAAFRHILDADYHGDPNNPFAINLEMNRMVARVFRACWKLAGEDKSEVKGLQSDFDNMRTVLSRAHRQGVIPDAKHLEWSTNLAFSEYALLNSRGAKPHADELLHLATDVEVERGGRGQPVFGFDGIYEFALSSEPDLLAELWRVVGLGGPPDRSSGSSSTKPR